MAIQEEADLSWARQLLAKDEFFARMTAQDQSRIINESVDFGVHLAEKTRERLGVPAGVESISRMLSGLGANVRIDEENGPPGPMSEYEEDLLLARFFTQRIRLRANDAAERGEWHTAGMSCTSNAWHGSCSGMLRTRSAARRRIISGSRIRCWDWCRYRDRSRRHAILPG